MVHSEFREYEVKMLRFSCLLLFNIYLEIALIATHHQLCPLNIKAEVMDRWVAQCHEHRIKRKTLNPNSSTQDSRVIFAIFLGIDNTTCNREILIWQNANEVKKNFSLVSHSTT